VRGVIAGNPKIIVGIAVAGVVALVTFASLPAGDRLDQRLETSSTTDDRASLYSETIDRSLESPVFGYGAPRPSADNLPSVGTHGQVWTLMFSHGFPALILFVVWILIAWHQTAHHRSGVGLAINASLVVVSVEIFYYGFVGMGLFLVMIGAAAAWRSDSNTGSAPRQSGVLRTRPLT
jgi:polysaccharide biosynthesis protein PslJ